MCRSAVEGGQRCFGDALKALNDAEATDVLCHEAMRAAEDACLTSQDMLGPFCAALANLRAAQDCVVFRQIELASTVEGEAHFRSLATPNHYTIVLARGLDIRLRNEAFRQSVLTGKVNAAQVRAHRALNSAHMVTSNGSLGVNNMPAVDSAALNTNAMALSGPQF